MHFGSTPSTCPCIIHTSGFRVTQFYQFGNYTLICYDLWGVTCFCHSGLHTLLTVKIEIYRFLYFLRSFCSSHDSASCQPLIAAAGPPTTLLFLHPSSFTNLHLYIPCFTKPFFSNTIIFMSIQFLQENIYNITFHLKNYTFSKIWVWWQRK